MRSHIYALSMLIAVGACTPSMRTTPAVTVLRAQAPHRYILTEHVPSTVDAIDGHPVTFRETVSIFSVSTRDSAGGTLWELKVDSTSSVIVPRSGVEQRG